MSLAFSAAWIDFPYWMADNNSNNNKFSSNIRRSLSTQYNILHTVVCMSVMAHQNAIMIIEHERKCDSYLCFEMIQAVCVEPEAEYQFQVHSFRFIFAIICYNGILIGLYSTLLCMH